MNFALALIVLLPLAYSATVNEKRFIDPLFVGYDILDLAKQVLTQFGTDETEAQCESTFCPEVVSKINGYNILIINILCPHVCKEMANEEHKARWLANKLKLSIQEEVVESIYNKLQAHVTIDGK